ncbi:hypothetical protein BC827DRAFT_1245377 [Russula dissimulans]|nr:hypothetical protein BC827DRAFT_1245377 [Russula dissimulans]
MLGAVDTYALTPVPCLPDLFHIPSNPSIISSTPLLHHNASANVSSTFEDDRAILIIGRRRRNRGDLAVRASHACVTLTAPPPFHSSPRSLPPTKIQRGAHRPRVWTLIVTVTLSCSIQRRRRFWIPRLSPVCVSCANDGRLPDWESRGQADSPEFKRSFRGCR